MREKIFLWTDFRLRLAVSSKAGARGRGEALDLTRESRVLGHKGLPLASFGNKGIFKPLRLVLLLRRVNLVLELLDEALPGFVLHEDRSDVVDEAVEVVPELAYLWSE